MAEQERVNQNDLLREAWRVINKRNAELAEARADHMGLLAASYDWQCDLANLLGMYDPCEKPADWNVLLAKLGREMVELNRLRRQRRRKR